MIETVTIKEILAILVVISMVVPMVLYFANTLGPGIRLSVESRNYVESKEDDFDRTIINHFSGEKVVHAAFDERNVLYNDKCENEAIIVQTVENVYRIVINEDTKIISSVRMNPIIK